MKKFQSKTDTYKSEARKSYRKVFLSFKNFVFTRYLSDRIFNEQLLCEWYVYLRFRGINPAKAYYYVDKLGNLYSGILKNVTGYQPTLFKELRKKIKAIDNSREALPVTLKTLPSFLRKIGKESFNDEEKNLGRDLLLFSLCNGGMSVEEMTMLKKEDIENYEPLSQKIAKKYIEARRKYVFPLNQSLLTPKQAAEMAIILIKPKLKIFKDSESVSRTLRMLWLSSAIYYGISPILLASIFEDYNEKKSKRGLPSECSFLRLCGSINLKDVNLKEINSKIVSCLFYGHKKWYAMRLRSYVRFEELEQRLSTLDKPSFRPELFYPCEEITRRIGHSLIWKEKPFIHDIVFFKSRPIDVYPLFREIWDLAWCFRDTRFGSYAEIQEKDIKEFQNAIGIFSSDFEVAPVGELPMKPGDTVVVVGGDYFNKSGKILKKETTGDDEGNVIYRIQLFDSNHKWSVSLDARFLQPH